MARSFNRGANDYIQVAAEGSALDFANDAPMACSIWVYFNNFHVDASIIAKGYNGTTTAYEAKLDNPATNIAIGSFEGTTNGVIAAHGFSTGAWNHVYFDYSGTTWSLYINGVASGTSVDSGPRNNAKQLHIGALDVNGPIERTIDGSAAEVAIFSAPLNAGAIAALAKGYSALFYPANLLFYAPLIGRTSPEIDRVGNLNGTLSGTAAFAHPRIIMPRPRRTHEFVIAPQQTLFPAHFAKRSYVALVTQ